MRDKLGRTKKSDREVRLHSHSHSPVVVCFVALFLLHVCNEKYFSLHIETLHRT